MAATIVTVETGLQIVAGLISLIQNSHSTGQPIDQATWDATTKPRDAALVKLDADIAAQKAAGK
jgi:hypothetical protein